ncbi:PucC family protein [Acidisoma cladoniae]|uniref:PucC family protein n=1 Tax=Acidisoma cladoniae TaxID=3040935 RepID=UPI00254CD0A4|nr:PucC family protein [Acidisoma sp. PAMC 29798]
MVSPCQILPLFQVSVDVTVSLLVGTLNLVMIAELGVSARPVAIMVALPLIFAPARALIGFRSDNYPLGAESGLRP